MRSRGCYVGRGRVCVVVCRLGLRMSRRVCRCLLRRLYRRQLPRLVDREVAHPVVLEDHLVVMVGDGRSWVVQVLSTYLADLDLGANLVAVELQLAAADLFCHRSFWVEDLCHDYIRGVVAPRSHSHSMVLSLSTHLDPFRQCRQQAQVEVHAASRGLSAEHLARDYLRSGVNSRVWWVTDLT